MPEPWQIALTVAVGLVTGILSGMFGIGGAILSTPAIRGLGASTFEAIGSTLPSIVPSAIAGSLRYWREGLIRWPVVLATSSVGAVTAIGASFLSHLVPGRGHVLMVATAALMGVAAAQTARAPVAALPEHGPTRSTGVGLVGPMAIGLAAGALSGLLGVGGGVVMLPAFAWWLRLPIKEAIATSLACVGLLAIPATVTHALIGDIDWWFAAPLAVAVVPGARLGSRLAIRASERRLRIMIASILGGVALVYGVLEVRVLLR